MGGHPYWYFVPYQNDLQAALDALRKREFEAGRYNPSIRFLKFSEPHFSRQKPGAQHASIEEAIEASAEDGTRSILDIQSIGSAPNYGVAAPFDPAELEVVCGSDKPSRAAVTDNLSSLLRNIRRGQCAYVAIYEGKGPREIFFAGYSYD